MHESEIAELDDHLSLSELTYTPGGELSYGVAKHISEQKRSAYRQEHGPEPEVAIPRQIDRQFEAAVERDAVEHDVRSEFDDSDRDQREAAKGKGKEGPSSLEDRVQNAVADRLQDSEAELGRAQAEGPEMPAGPQVSRGMDR